MKLLLLLLLLLMASCQPNQNAPLPQEQVPPKEETPAFSLLPYETEIRQLIAEAAFLTDFYKQQYFDSYELRIDETSLSITFDTYYVNQVNPFVISFDETGKRSGVSYLNGFFGEPLFYERYGKITEAGFNYRSFYDYGEYGEAIYISSMYGTYYFRYDAAQDNFVSNDSNSPGYQKEMVFLETLEPYLWLAYQRIREKDHLLKCNEDIFIENLERLLAGDQTRIAYLAASPKSYQELVQAQKQKTDQQEQLRKEDQEYLLGFEKQSLLALDLIYTTSDKTVSFDLLGTDYQKELFALLKTSTVEDALPVGLIETAPQIYLRYQIGQEMKEVRIVAAGHFMAVSHDGTLYWYMMEVDAFAWAEQIYKELQEQ